MVAGMGDLPQERSLSACGLLSAKQTNKRTAPQSRNQREGGGEKRKICPRRPANLMRLRSSLCDNHCGFVFQRQTEEREREYQRLEFSLTSMVCVFPEAAVSSVGGKDGLRACRPSKGAALGVFQVRVPVPLSFILLLFLFL